jgi:hypothetical protein
MPDVGLWQWNRLYTSAQKIQKAGDRRHVSNTLTTRDAFWQGTPDFAVEMAAARPRCPPSSRAELPHKPVPAPTPSSESSADWSAISFQSLRKIITHARDLLQVEESCSAEEKAVDERENLKLYRNAGEPFTLVSLHRR